MALVSLIVGISTENHIEEAVCRIENKRFELGRTSDTSFVGEHTVDVVGLVQYSAVIRADSGARWSFTIAKSEGGDPFLTKSHVVPDDTTIDTMSGLVPLP